MNPNRPQPQRPLKAPSPGQFARITALYSELSAAPPAAREAKLTAARTTDSLVADWVARMLEAASDPRLTQPAAVELSAELQDPAFAPRRAELAEVLDYSARHPVSGDVALARAFRRLKWIVSLAVLAIGLLVLLAFGWLGFR